MHKTMKGSITVFVMLSFVLILSFVMVLIEGARENVVFLKAEIQAEVGKQNLLSDYHQKLQSQYDIWSIDISYGSETPSYDNTKERLSYYYKKSMRHDERNWLYINEMDTEVGNVRLLTDAQGDEFFRQAISWTKKDTGIAHVEYLLEVFEGYKREEDAIESIINTADELQIALSEVNGSMVEVEPAEWRVDEEGNQILVKEAVEEMVHIENPLDSLFSQGYLIERILKEHKISDYRFDKEKLPSERVLVKGNAQADTTQYSIVEHVMFVKYLIEHFTSFEAVQELEAENMKYQLEYMIGGLGHDRGNLEKVFAEILIIRLIDNYLNVMSDVEIQAEAHATAILMTELVPWLEPIVYQGILIKEAYEDSMVDLQMLSQGRKVPILKVVNRYAFEFLELGYQEYLFLLLLLQKRKTLSMRALDVIEQELCREQSSFRVDGCLVRAMFETTFEDLSGRRYIVSKVLKYD